MARGPNKKGRSRREPPRMSEEEFYHRFGGGPVDFARPQRRKYGVGTRLCVMVARPAAFKEVYGRPLSM